MSMIVSKIYVVFYVFISSLNYFKKLYFCNLLNRLKNICNTIFLNVDKGLTWDLSEKILKVFIKYDKF